MCQYQKISPGLGFFHSQVLGSEEYKNSQRLSIYLTMPTEVDTHHILEVYKYFTKKLKFLHIRIISCLSRTHWSWESELSVSPVSSPPPSASPTSQTLLCPPLRGSRDGDAESPLTGRCGVTSPHSLEYPPACLRGRQREPSHLWWRAGPHSGSWSRIL